MATRKTGKVGRPSKKLPEPSSDSIATVARMQRKYPDMKFVICPVCGEYAVVWDEGEKKDIYMGMHPMGCYDSATGAKIRTKVKKERAAVAEAERPSLFDV